MVYWKDPNSPTNVALEELKGLLSSNKEKNDEERIQIADTFIEEFILKYGYVPDGVIIDILANFCLRGYMSLKEDEYKILSQSSIGRRKRNEAVYHDEIKY